MSSLLPCMLNLYHRYTKSLTYCPYFLSTLTFYLSPNPTRGSSSDHVKWLLSPSSFVREKGPKIIFVFIPVSISSRGKTCVTQFQDTDVDFPLRVSVDSCPTWFLPSGLRSQTLSVFPPSVVSPLLLGGPLSRVLLTSTFETKVTPWLLPFGPFLWVFLDSTSIIVLFS